MLMRKDYPVLFAKTRFFLWFVDHALEEFMNSGSAFMEREGKQVMCLEDVQGFDPVGNEVIASDGTIIGPQTIMANGDEVELIHYSCKIADVDAVLAELSGEAKEAYGRGVDRHREYIKPGTYI